MKKLLAIALTTLSLSALAQNLTVLDAEEIGTFNETQYNYSNPVSMREYSESSDIKQVCQINSAFSLKDGEVLTYKSRETFRASNDLQTTYKFNKKAYGSTFPISIHCLDKNYNIVEIDDLNEHFQGILSIQ